MALLARSAALILLLVFGVKAALVPLHFWLPDASNFYFPEPNPLFYENLPWSDSTRQ